MTGVRLWSLMHDEPVQDSRPVEPSDSGCARRPPDTWLQTELGLTFYWDVLKLWDADLPLAWMQVRELAWLLDKPFWNDGSKKLAVSGRDVAEAPERHRAEYERAMAADLSFPINVILLRGRWVIMDGLHRLLKAWMCGHEMIVAKQAREQDIPLFSRKWSDPHHHP